VSEVHLRYLVSDTHRPTQPAGAGIYEEFWGDATTALVDQGSNQGAWWDLARLL